MSKQQLPRIAWKADEFAEMVGMSAWQVRELCRQGEIPATKFGAQWVIADDYVQAVKSGTVTAPAA